MSTLMTYFSAEGTTKAIADAVAKELKSADDLKAIIRQKELSNNV